MSRMTPFKDNAQKTADEAQAAEAKTALEKRLVTEKTDAERNAQVATDVSAAR